MIFRFFPPLLMIVLLSTPMGSSFVTSLQAAAPASIPVGDRFAGSLPDTNTWLVNQDQSSSNDLLLQDNGLHFIVPTIGGTSTTSWIWKSNLPTTSDWSIAMNVENLATTSFTNSFAGIGLNVGNTNSARSFGMALSYDPTAGGVLWEASLDAGSNSVMTITNSSVRKGGLLLSYSSGRGTVTAAYCLHPKVQNPSWVSLGSTSLNQLSLTNTNDTFEIAITASSSGIRLGRNDGLSAHDFTITNGAIGVNVPNPAAQFINLHQIGTLSYTKTPVQIHLPAASSGLPVNVSVESGPATLEGDRVHILGTGTVTLLDTQAGNDRYSAVSNTDFFTIVPAEQRINFPAASILNFYTKKYTFPFLPYNISLRAIATSGLPVTYTILKGPVYLAAPIGTLVPTNSSTTSVLFLNGSSGSVTIQVDQAGDEYHYPAPSVKRTFQLNIIYPASSGGGGGSGSGFSGSWNFNEFTGFLFSY